MVWAQIAQAGIAGLGTFLGGQSANKAADKAATKAQVFQLELNYQAFENQKHLANNQYSQIQFINDKIDQHNYAERQRAQAEGSSTESSIDFDRLVKDSEAAGFNPLTVLRAGGLAGYSSTKGGYSPQYMTYLPVGEISQINNPGQAVAAPVTNSLGDAVNAALGAWNSYDPYKAERGQMELALARAQLKNLDSDTAANNRRLAIPTWTGSGFKTTTGGFGGAVKSALAATAAPGAKGLGAPSVWKAGDVDVTNPIPYKAGSVNPNFADAAALEDRYGELGGSVLGIGNMLADLYQNRAAIGTYGSKLLNEATAAWMGRSSQGANYAAEQAALQRAAMN